MSKANELAAAWIGGLEDARRIAHEITERIARREGRDRMQREQLLGALSAGEEIVEQIDAAIRAAREG